MTHTVNGIQPLKTVFVYYLTKLVYNGFIPIIWERDKSYKVYTFLNVLLD